MSKKHYNLMIAARVKPEQPVEPIFSTPASRTDALFAIPAELANMLSLNKISRSNRCFQRV